MLGNSRKVHEAVEEVINSGPFRQYLSDIMGVLLTTDKATEALNTRADAVLSSSEFTQKVSKAISGFVETEGKSAVQSKLPDIVASGEVQEAVTAKVFEAIRQTLEKNSPKTVEAFFGTAEARNQLQGALKSAAKGVFNGPDFQAQLTRDIQEFVQKETEEIVIEEIRDKLDGPAIRQSVQSIVDGVVKDYIGLSFPNLIKVERLDGTISSPDLVHHKFQDVLMASSIPEANILMVGPAGSGKTKIAQDVANALGRPFYFNGPVQSEYKLLGFRDATGTYAPTPFYNAFTAGGVYLFDEIDASSPQALVAFNTAIANRCCDFPGAGEPVFASADFICMAAANTFGRGANHDYVGRNQLDAATLDRFIVIEIDYDESMERLLARNDKWVTKIQNWRQRARELSVRHVISMRASIMGAHLLKSFSEHIVEDMVVWRGLDRNTVAKIKAT